MRTKKPAKAVWKRYPHSAVYELFIGSVTVASVEQMDPDSEATASVVEWVVFNGVDPRPYGYCSTVKEAKAAAEAAVLASAETIAHALRARKAGAR